jgi:hypothetical protein
MAVGDGRKLESLELQHQVFYTEIIVRPLTLKAMLSVISRPAVASHDYGFPFETKNEHLSKDQSKQMITLTQLTRQR